MRHWHAGIAAADSAEAAARQSGARGLADNMMTRKYHHLTWLGLGHRSSSTRIYLARPGGGPLRRALSKSD